MKNNDMSDSMGYAFGGAIKKSRKPWGPALSDHEPGKLFSTMVSEPDWGIAMESRIKNRKKKEKAKQDQLDRIEAKLDKLLGPQLINGVWR